MLTRLFLVLVALSLVSAAASGGAPNGKATPVSQTSSVDGAPVSAEEALRMDAREVARMYGITIADALTRLDLQSTVIPEFEDKISDVERGRFGGLYIEHQPVFRVVVLLTSGDLSNIADHVPDRLRGLVDVLTVERTYGELRSMQDRALRLRSVLPFNADVNVRMNRVELDVVAMTPSMLALTAQTLRAAAASSGEPLPDWVKVNGLSSLGGPDLDVFGGLNITPPACTTGFSIIDSHGDSGVTTAGHRDNVGVYAGYTLTYRTQRWTENWDVQWYSRASTNFPAKFLRGGGVFYQVTGKKARWNQPMGAVVCHHGIFTDFSCGEIQSNVAAPSWVPNASPTFMKVNYVRAGGDSGGPVFVGGEAWGTHSGHIDGIGVYMAANYIENNTMNLYIKGT